MKIEVQERDKRIIKRLAIIVAVWTLIIICVQVGIWHGRKLERACWEKALNEWQEILEEIIKEYKVLSILERIIKAESNGRFNVWGQNGEFGICQFKENTFYWLAEKANLPDPNWKNQSQQIALLNWSIRNGFGDCWSTFKNGR